MFHAFSQLTSEAKLRGVKRDRHDDSREIGQQGVLITRICLEFGAAGSNCCGMLIVRMEHVRGRRSRRLNQ